jgi:hypothetical protein
MIARRLSLGMMWVSALAVGTLELLLKSSCRR